MKSTTCYWEDWYQTLITQTNKNVKKRKKKKPFGNETANLRQNAKTKLFFSPLFVWTLGNSKRVCDIRTQNLMVLAMNKLYISNPGTSSQTSGSQACQRRMKTSQHRSWGLQCPCCSPGPCWSPSIAFHAPFGCSRWHKQLGEGTRLSAQSPSQPTLLKSWPGYLSKTLTITYLVMTDKENQFFKLSTNERYSIKLDI